MLTAKMSVRWKGREFDRWVVRGMGRNATAAAQELKVEIQSKISTRGFGVTAPAGPKLKSKRVLNVKHSAPGGYPYEQTGDLIASFSSFLDRFAMRSMTAYVTSNSPYLLALEFGSPQIGLAPRPHVRRTLIDHRAALAAILLRPL